MIRICIAMVILCSAADVRAEDELTWLGFARKVPRAWSASRDTPALNLMVMPRDVRTAGGELAIATWRMSSTSLRLGFAGLVELESDGETTGFGNVFPKANGAILWRGSYAWYGALSLDRIGNRLCNGCAIELALQYRHESQHYTGSQEGDPGMDLTGEPFVGDDAIADAAIAVPRGDWLFAARALAFVFIPGRSSYAGGPALDLHVRYRGARIQPFASGYAEQLFDREFHGRLAGDAYLLRALAGVALPSTLGDVMLYVSADVGNRKGIRGNTEEATLGIGARLALGAAN